MEFLQRSLDNSGGKKNCTQRAGLDSLKDDPTGASVRSTGGSLLHFECHLAFIGRNFLRNGVC
jgi:hypothetical protein